MSEFEIHPSRTQYDFMLSTELENCLMGPRGEGKTEAGIMAMTYHASLQAKECRPIPWAIIRDTWSNLERTTLKSFLKPRPGSFALTIRDRLQIRDAGRFVCLPGYWEAFFFGIDSLGDLNKLQSMQLGGLWIEEAAPAAEEDIGSGVAEDAWAIGITSLRHPVTTGPRAQITMNYPDEDHWTWQRFHEEGIGRLFRIFKGENRHISQQYRENMAMALKNRPDLLARLAEGRPTQVQIGEAVTPEYNPDLHRSRLILTPIKGVQVIRFWDGGLHPACVFAQITPKGYFHVLDSLRGENVGMKQFIETQVKAIIARRYTGVDSWKDTGDPTLATPENADSSITPATIIENELKTHYQGGESSWMVRREAIKELLNRLVDGKPMLQLSHHDTIMHRALNGGWHYHKTPTGEVVRDKPEKDKHSHPADALCHGIAKLFRYQKERREAPPPQTYGKSYAVRSLHG